MGFIIFSFDCCGNVPADNTNNNMYAFFIIMFFIKPVLRINQIHHSRLSQHLSMRRFALLQVS